MTLRELILELNPITENKYTKYKSREIHWCIEDHSFYNGDRDSRKISLQYFKNGWNKVGEIFLTPEGMQVDEVEFWDDVPVKCIAEFTNKVKIPVDFKERK